MRLSAAAWRHRTASTGALAGQQWIAALDHAREANRLHRTEAGNDLALIARLLAG